MENIVSRTLRFNDFEKLLDRGFKINGGWEQNKKKGSEKLGLSLNTLLTLFNISF